LHTGANHSLSKVISRFNPLVINEGEKGIPLFQELIAESGDLPRRGFRVLHNKETQLQNKWLG
jgi:hypothetical protein